MSDDEKEIVEIKKKIGEKEKTQRRYRRSFACSKCGSNNTYKNYKSKEIVCRKCQNRRLVKDYE